MSDSERIRGLEKEIRTLQKKLNRVERNLINSEKMWDRNSNLFQNLNAEIEEQRLIIKEKKDQLEALAMKLAKYLSPQVYEAIFTGERDVRIETYKKALTVFFSDIVGFTPLSEKMSPQHLADWLNEYLNDMAEICLKYEGTLDKFIGDAVMVFFGDPKTRGKKEDALQCVKMGIDMCNRAKEKGIKIRVGIHSGECIVGNFGAESKMEYTVVGKTVNMTARLESGGEPGKIHISKDTYELICEDISCDPRGNVYLKGLKDPIESYWVSLG